MDLGMIQSKFCGVADSAMRCTWINKTEMLREKVQCSCVHREIDSLGQRSGVREVDGAGAPTDVLFPSVSSGLATPSRALVSTEGGTDFGTARTDVDVNDARVRACGPDPFPDVPDVPRPQTA